MKRLLRLFIYRKKLVNPYVDLTLNILKAAGVIASLMLVVTIVFKYGFIVSEADHAMIDTIYNYILWLFVANSLLHITFDFDNTRKQYSKLAWLMTILLYLTVIPTISTEPISGAYKFCWQLFDSDIYRSAVLITLAVLHISNGIVKILSRRVNPSFIFSASFAVIILIGAGLLMLPRATYAGIDFTDALFISTSATCVTGLATVDIATTFTPLGITFIAVLIQVGGLGVMTLTSFFALFFMGNTSLCNQTLLSDMISSKSLSSLLTTLLYILGFTAIIELIGAAAILADIHGTMNMTLNEEITFSLFHSISAFCNAGFSTLPSNLGNEMLMSGHNPFYITISILVILGSIGFPILVNLNDWIKYIFRRAKKQFQQHSFRVDRQIHIYDINTKIVVLVTFLLLGVGTLSIGALEWNGAFADMPIIDRCVQSFFTAVCPRTAGFSSVNIDSFGIQSIMIILFLMVIGGAAQSTAGGIKMNTFAVILLNIKAILRGNDKVIVFNRVLSHDSIRRSNSTLVLYILFVFIALFLLTIFEPEESLLALLFETISALSTVGSSLDLTMELGNNSKYVIIALMFIGRVGVLTIMASIIKEKSTSRVEFTSGNIIIN
ncbi:MAG: potassium transporter TrkG [Rikenellaceae bacterium]